MHAALYKGLLDTLGKSRARTTHIMFAPFAVIRLEKMCPTYARSAAPRVSCSIK